MVCESVIDSVNSVIDVIYSAVWYDSSSVWYDSSSLPVMHPSQTDECTYWDDSTVGNTVVSGVLFCSCQHRQVLSPTSFFPLSFSPFPLASFFSWCCCCYDGCCHGSDGRRRRVVDHTSWSLILTRHCLWVAVMPPCNDLVSFPQVLVALLWQ